MKSYSKRVCLTFRDGSTKMGDGEYAPAFDLSKLWNRLQGFDCNDLRASCLAELCDRIEEDGDFEDMLLGFQDYSYSTSAESNFRFLT
ncbi:hypothetical protein F2Q68_00003290 [Brassica cretica]|uniref:Uncharacterized protein n=1 Tax=Brassica cretica TaxID=69181 RepID=A0A8S9JBC5_BRACR|nr:hypothetical protein F2Q68_00003290 [Brassica cretica]